MAKPKRKLNTFSIVVILLLSVAVFVLTLLYLDVWRKNTLLALDIERLESSQVLLMVPDEHAEAVAKWMSENPEATKKLLVQAQPKQKIKVNFGPDTGLEKDHVGLFNQAQNSDRLATEIEIFDELKLNANDELLMSNSGNKDDISILLQGSEAVSKLSIVNVNNIDKSVDAKQVIGAHTVSENAEGVKIIVLPHGGIRVTTREND
ncbi:hypothetical protein HQQ94_08935 [Shewanella sp. VB17]|uniref:hypothetical protein n=1 Tax=Shewanella sp. VB17 TaxID=2739432 RepID=UPI001C26270A|nr:hypothetical protein [Shewanella sp. VB17]NRD73365.1 hypothetical protein [Shewanella sp. VB17]